MYGRLKMDVSGTNSKLSMMIKKSSEYVLEIILVLLFLILSLTTRGFFTFGNWMNILRNISLQGCIAFGMTLVIIGGEIDLSVASTVALSGVIVGVVSGKLSGSGIMPIEAAVFAGILLCIVVAMLVGFISGSLITKFRMPSFIVTLGMMNILYGLAAVVSKGFPVTTYPAWYSFIGAGYIFKVIPVPVIILLVVFVVTLITMNYTTLGRAIYATGGNQESARLSGINVKKIKIINMMTVQVCSAISGILISSQVMSGNQNFGKGWEMTAISAVIIGGTSFSGGSGKIGRTLVGLIFLGIIINGMTLLNVNEYAQYIARGLLILIAVLINIVQATKRSGIV
jgi:ribose/xylose/arabinose/galactoside ABC-type transport system permease subunit